MEPESLFLHTLADLRRLIGIGDEYSGLQASRILRHLFLDGNPLIDQANRTTRLAIKYTIGSWIEQKIIDALSPYPIIFISHLHTIYPPDIAVFPSWPFKPKSITRDQLLKTPIVYAVGKLITIRQMIQHAAHVLGGVHSGKATNEDEAALDKVYDALRTNPQPASLLHLFPLCRVVLDGLGPLEIELQNIIRSGGN
jgi:hypothetical protein